MPEYRYLKTHPHITFRVDLRTSPPLFWMLLGEAKSKAEHVSRALLSPRAGWEMMQVYLAKGVMATTAIEGNTLSEDEVRAVLEGELKLPPSREYLQIEVQNVVAAYNDALEEIRADPSTLFTVERLCDFNRMILSNLDLEEGVVPGEIRTDSVVVGRYRAAPAADCTHLLGRLCEWLNSRDFDAPDDRPEMAMPLAIVKAVIAHLYLAWIHPFGDGNGRTARLLELQILLRAGFPTPTCQLLSNHYNQTRAEYYRQLDVSSRSSDHSSFLMYAVQGLVDQLREQLERIWVDQFRHRWEQHVYQAFGGARKPVEHRQLMVVLAISKRWYELGQQTSRSEIRTLTPELAIAYGNKTEKTVTRDLNAIASRDLLRLELGGFVPNDDLLMGLRAEIPAAESPTR